LSWLAREHGVYDLFGALIDQRNAHSDWIASVAEAEQWKRSEYRPIVILGGEYKADSSLTDGSPARLLSNQTGWPIVDTIPTEPSIIVIGVPHSIYKEWGFDGHVVIDPWDVVPGAIHPGYGPSKP
jgi:hypothetical protein